MTKNSIYLIIMGIIILIFFGLVVCNVFVSNNELNIDGAYFVLPEGFHETGSTVPNVVINLTDGNHEIYIEKCENGVGKSMQDYINYKNESNRNVKISNFTVNDTMVYKGVVYPKDGIVHYWFEKNGNAFTLYTWDNNPNSDLLAKELIYSMHT